MRINSLETTNQNFKSTYNKNLEYVVTSLAKKGYPKLHQGHLDTLRHLEDDGLKGVSLNLDCTFKEYPRLIVESELMNKCTDFVTEVLEKVRASYGTTEPRILDASMAAASETLKLCAALKGELPYGSDFISEGVNLSRDDKPFSKEERFYGLTVFDLDIDKLLEFLEPCNKVPESIIRYHSKLYLQAQRTKAEYAKFLAILKSN